MKKEFEAPELEIIIFADDEDIITSSAMGLGWGINGDDWSD